MLAQQQSQAPVQSTTPAPARDARPEGGAGNAAQAQDAGIAAGGSAPEHELAGPLASLILDVMPLAEAIEMAVPFLDNPAVRTWLDGLDPATLASVGGVADRIVEAVWPAGTGFQASVGLGASIELGADGASTLQAMHPEGGGVDGTLTTDLSLSAGVLLGGYTEDAFGQREGTAAEAGAAIHVITSWDLDAALSPGTLVTDVISNVALSCLLAGEATGTEQLTFLLDETVDALLTLTPDYTVELTGGGTLDAELNLLVDQGTLDTVVSLSGPLLEQAQLDIHAGGALTAGVTVGGEGGAEAFVRAEAAAEIAAAAQLGWLTGLLAPAEWQQLQEMAGAGLVFEAHARLLDPETSLAPSQDGDNTWADLTLSRSWDGTTRDETVRIQGRGDVAALATSAGAGSELVPLSDTLAGGSIPQVTHTITHSLDPAEARQRAAEDTGLASLLMRLGGSLTPVQEICELGIRGTQVVDPVALRCAAEAGLQTPGGSLRDAAEILLAARFEQPLPAWTRLQEASIAAGVAAMGELSEVRLQGRVAYGVGGKQAAGVGELAASCTKRASVESLIDKKVDGPDRERVMRLMGRV